MISISGDHAFSFFPDKTYRGRVFPKICDPKGQFRLQIEAQRIGYFESCFRRTPGMEPEVVYPVGPGRQEHVQPTHLDGWWLTGKRKDTTLKGIMKETTQGIQQY